MDSNSFKYDQKRYTLFLKWNLSMKKEKNRILKNRIFTKLQGFFKLPYFPFNKQLYIPKCIKYCI